MSAVIIYENTELVAFVDIGPIRTGRTQIIPRAHFETFEQLPPEAGHSHDARATLLRVRGELLAPGGESVAIQ